jgi:predicted ATPase
MGLPVLIIGKSGSGKSTSLRNFKDAGVINVLGKPLPFRNDFKTANTDSYSRIRQLIKDGKSKSIVIDDAGYLITNAFMRGHASTGKGNDIFAFYNAMADNFWGLVHFAASAEVADDKIIYFLMHEDKNDFGETKPKTIGKMLDEKVCIEGMFTIVLHAVKRDGRYVFLTKTDGLDVTKTPMGMFDTDEIDNDLKVVDDTIREYWNMNNKEAQE